MLGHVNVNQEINSKHLPEKSNDRFLEQGRNSKMLPGMLS